MSEEITIGVSACLLGEQVRWDSGHKRDLYVTKTLSDFFSFVAVCPEVEIGLGTPREPIRLSRQEGEVRLTSQNGERDLSTQMYAYAEERCQALEALGLSGYILKGGSPSCGMERVKIWDHNGIPSKTGRGLFAEVLIKHYPLLPVEEEGRLHDARIRENFIERVFAHKRLAQLFDSGTWKVGDVVAFHSREKYLILAHETKGYEDLGRMVAVAKGQDRAAFAKSYRERFMTALSHQASIGQHVNVLQHMAGYFKKELGDEDKSELQSILADYAAGLVPLVVPITLIRHYVRKFKVEYLAQQHYLAPHPKELMLRNQV